MVEGKSWPFQEAQALHKAIGGKTPEKGYVLFETGYGPSGLPHIGTFGEVARTSMVRHAFETLYPDIPTKLICFSDDMDGLRKVPTNLPNQDMLAKHLSKPLTAIPDPFGEYESFAHHNNARLKAFLDSYGFEYEFKSATECYKAGNFDETLIAIAKNYQAVLDIILPTLGEERRATYSPFLPVDVKSEKVLQVPVEVTDADKGMIAYTNEDGECIETTVTGGNVKSQWKADWAMRWVALGVDYEMYGKDLTPSAILSGKITRAIGGNPPQGFQYELFLDAVGQKISKSKGNGLSMEEWLRYGTPESLSYYMFQSPRKAKRLHFDVIPKAVDEYFTWLDKFPNQEPQAQLDNPVWHIHQGTPPKSNLPVTFALLLNLAAACNPDKPDILWGFIANYAPGTTPQTAPQLDVLVQRAVAYYNDFVKPHKSYHQPNEQETAALRELADMLHNLSDDTPTDEIQTQVFTVGKNHHYENLRDWFKLLYTTLLGQEQGPRMGSFIALYGREDMLELVEKALAGKLGKEAA